MAGVALALRRFQQSDELLAPVAAFTNASIMAAGPWIYTAVALAAVKEITDSFIGRDALISFTVVLAYIVSLSLVAAAPVTIIGLRVLADELYRERYDDIRGLFSISVLGGSILSALLAGCVFLVLSAPPTIALVAIAATPLVGMLWVALGFAGVVREYAYVSIAFAVGLAVGTAITVFAAWLDGRTELTLVGFLVGLMVIFLVLVTRLFIIFNHPCSSLRPAALLMLARLRGTPELTLGALAGAMSIWVDKWIIWASPFGVPSSAGLPYAPAYDAPMFISGLTVIPAVALFITALETTLLRQYGLYTRAIDGHATLDHIEACAEDVRHITVKTLLGIIFLQAVISTILFLAAPIIVERMGFQFQQIDVIRGGVIGALFQFIFIACSAILISFNATGSYIALQIFAVVSVAIGTALCSHLDVKYLSMGYMGAFIVTGMLSFVPLLWVLRTINFRIFVGSATSGAR